MRGLEVRLRRLENRRKQRNTHAPTLHEFLEANSRQQIRRVYNAISRLAGEERAWSRLSEYDRKVLRNDTEEQRRKDADVLRRSEGVHGSSEQETTGHAERAKLRLRSMERVGVTE